MTALPTGVALALLPSHVLDLAGLCLEAAIAGEQAEEDALLDALTGREPRDIEAAMNLATQTRPDLAPELLQLAEACEAMDDEPAPPPYLMGRAVEAVAEALEGVFVEPASVLGQARNIAQGLTYPTRNGLRYVREAIRARPLAVPLTSEQVMALAVRCVRAFVGAIMPEADEMQRRLAAARYGVELRQALRCGGAA